MEGIESFSQMINEQVGSQSFIDGSELLNRQKVKVMDKIKSREHFSDVFGSNSVKNGRDHYSALNN